MPSDDSLLCSVRGARPGIASKVIGAFPACKVWAATRADLECRRAPSRPPLSATPLPPPANTPPMNM